MLMPYDLNQCCIQTLPNRYEGHNKDGLSSNARDDIKGELNGKDSATANLAILRLSRLPIQLRGKDSGR